MKNKKYRNKNNNSKFNCVFVFVPCMFLVLILLVDTLPTGNKEIRYDMFTLKQSVDTYLENETIKNKINYNFKLSFYVVNVYIL